MEFRWSPASRGAHLTQECSLHARVSSRGGMRQGSEGLGGSGKPRSTSAQFGSRLLGCVFGKQNISSMLQII